MLYVFVGSFQKVFHEPSFACTRNYSVGESSQACVPPNLKHLNNLLLKGY